MGQTGAHTGPVLRGFGTAPAVPALLQRNQPVQTKPAPLLARAKRAPVCTFCRWLLVLWHLPSRARAGLPVPATHGLPGHRAPGRTRSLLGKAAEPCAAPRRREMEPGGGAGSAAVGSGAAGGLGPGTAERGGPPPAAAHPGRDVPGRSPPRTAPRDRGDTPRGNSPCPGTGSPAGTSRTGQSGRNRGWGR